MRAMFSKRAAGVCLSLAALLLIAGGVRGSDKSHLPTTSVGSSSVSEPCYQPVIIAAQKVHNPKRFRIAGSNFTDDMTIYINDVPVPPNTWRYRNGKVILKHSFIKLMPKHSPVVIRIVNNCGAETSITLTR